MANSGEWRPAATAQLHGPSALAVDPAGQTLRRGPVQQCRSRDSAGVARVSASTRCTNAASGLPGPISPGEIVVVSGSGLGPAQLVSGAAGADGVYSGQLAGTMVQFKRDAGTGHLHLATQVAVVVPYSVVSGAAQITVDYKGQSSAPFSIPIASIGAGGSSRWTPRAKARRLRLYLFVRVMRMLYLCSK